MKHILFILFLVFGFYSLSAGNEVHRIIIEGVINPAATAYIKKSIDRAETERVELLIIQLDTPGGLMDSMHDIVKAVQNSTVPVAVYVAPGGSRAGSAGVFITYAAHIAAMAPSTNIGSAHPVFSGQGQPADTTMTETMMEKVTNDAVAKIRSVAEKRGRNADWAEKAIRESANITETEALKLRVIDYIVPNADSLLVVLDGKTIHLDSGEIKTLKTKGAGIISYEMDWREKLLDIITNPNVAYILLMLGIYGLLLEFYNPGSILPGIIGGISLILALYSMQTLPVNYAGLLLIIFAVILFLLEIKVPSFGLLTIGGVSSLVLGTIMLFDSPLAYMRVSWQILISVSGFTVLFFVFAIGMAVRAQQKQPETGAEGIIGEEGVVLKTIEPRGMIKIHGEYWQAESEVRIEQGKRVKVLQFDNKQLVLKVKEI
jgi:membrane-bound serine protease (ClpP class)